MNYKLIAGILSVVFGIVSCVPYFISIYKKTTTPHSFTWLIWTLTNGITFYAQSVSNAGWGALGTGAGSLICFSVFLLSIKYGEKHITVSDWISLFIALATIPLWIVSRDPLFSVIVLTVIDCLGFYPTIRKSWHSPYGESAVSYLIGGIGSVFDLLAMQSYALVNWIYPTCIMLSTVVLLLVIGTRRKLCPKN